MNKKLGNNNMGGSSQNISNVLK